MMKRQFSIGVVVLLAVLTLAACQPQVIEVPQETQSAEPVEAQQPVAGRAGAQVEAEQEYVLGVVLPFTGPLGTYGTGFREGIELAVEQMNEQLSAAGSNVRFKTVSADTEGTPDGAAKAVQTVVQTSGAQVIVGPLTTSEVLGAKQFADENKIAIVAPASSGLAAAIPGDFIFRPMYPPDSFAGQAFEGIAIARGYQNVVALQVEDPFGNGMTDIFKAGFQAAGGGEVAVVKYAPDPPDLSSEVAKVKA